MCSKFFLKKFALKTACCQAPGPCSQAVGRFWEHCGLKRREHDNHNDVM